MEVQAQQPAKAESGDAQPTTAGARQTLSRHGKAIGRPRTRLVQPVTVPTRCQLAVYQYLKGLAAALRIPLTTMSDDMIRQFLQQRPWEHGLQWRTPKVATATVGGHDTGTGWVQANLQIQPDLGAELELLSERLGVSKAAIGYTAIFWWVTYIYPPKAA